MLKYKIRKISGADLQYISENILSSLRETGYDVMEENENSILFDANDDGSELISKTFFSNKADKGVIKFVKKQEGTFIDLNYFISVQPLLILGLITIVGAFFVSYSILFSFLIVSAVYVYRIYTVKNNMKKILKKYMVPAQL